MLLAERSSPSPRLRLDACTLMRGSGRPAPRLRACGTSIAEGVVAEVVARPKLVNVGLLAFHEPVVVFRGGDVVAESMSDFFRCTQRREPESATVGTFTVDDPDVVGLIGIIVVLRQAVPG